MARRLRDLCWRYREAAVWFCCAVVVIVLSR
jgi:hypothetical protein